jgi:hypothetical protein
MKHLSLLAVALALAGCSSLENRSYGSWLDHLGERKPATYPYTPEETEALKAQAGQLHARADDLRLKLASEKDRVRRVDYMYELDDVGRDLRPIEQKLRQGGTEGRRYPAPADYTQGGGD